VSKWEHILKEAWWKRLWTRKRGIGARHLNKTLNKECEGGRRHNLGEKKTGQNHRKAGRIEISLGYGFARKENNGM